MVKTIRSKGASATKSAYTISQAMLRERAKRGMPSGVRDDVSGALWYE